MGNCALIPPGFSNVKIATLVSESTGLKINHQDISNYKRKNLKFVCLKKRRAIIKYFISQDFLPAPKPRKAPQCRNCGTQYPTRKLVSVHVTGEEARVEGFASPSAEPLIQHHDLHQSNNSPSIMQFQTADKVSASK